MQLVSDLIYEFNPPISQKTTKSSDTSVRNKTREDWGLVNASQDLFQIKPDIFEELDSDD